MAEVTRGRKIWIMGGANIDILGTASGELVDRDSNPGKVELRFGGVGRNIAEAVALLGDKPQFISCFGKDHYGELLKADCLKLGIKLDYFMESDKYGTSIYLAIMDENHDMKVALNDMDILTTVRPEDLNEAIRVMGPDGYLIIDSNFPEEVIDHICENAPCPIAADPVSIAKIDRLTKSLDRIAIVKPNRIEAEHISGIKIEDEESASKALDWFMDKGVKEIAITMAERGVAFGYSEREKTACDYERFGRFESDGDARMHENVGSESENTRVKKWYTHRPLTLDNATGGGDAFLGAYVSRRTQGAPPEEAAKFAISAAALNIETPLEERRKIRGEDIEKNLKELNIKSKEI